MYNAEGGLTSRELYANIYVMNELVAFIPIVYIISKVDCMFSGSITISYAALARRHSTAETDSVHMGILLQFHQL